MQRHRKQNPDCERLSKTSDPGPLTNTLEVERERKSRKWRRGRAGGRGRREREKENRRRRKTGGENKAVGEEGPGSYRLKEAEETSINCML